MVVDYKAIGMRIKTKRRECSLTQERLAELLDVTVGYISQVERGITKINLEMLGRLSTVLKCDMAFFVSGVNTEADEYLTDELSEKLKKLSNRDRKIASAVMDFMLEND